MTSGRLTCMLADKKSIHLFGIIQAFLLLANMAEQQEEISHMSLSCLQYSCVNMFVWKFVYLSVEH